MLLMRDCQDLFRNLSKLFYIVEISEKVCYTTLSMQADQYFGTTYSEKQIKGVIL